MSVKELPVFPQYTLSSAQGRVGMRKWVLENENVHEFVTKVCKSHWPGDENTRPIMVQVGAWDEKLITKSGGGGPDSQLPHYKETLVVAQYQFLLFDAPWPHCIPKPTHPTGTTLSLRVRGSGQFLTLPPGALLPQGDGKQPVVAQNANCAVLIPITEYHITCDRMLPGSVPGWKFLEGKTNSEPFLGEPIGTLLFDTWECDHSFVPAAGIDGDVGSASGTSENSVYVNRGPERFKLTCVLKSRDAGIVSGDEHAGWNHLYLPTENGMGWVKVQITENGKKRSLYPAHNMSQLFIDNSCNQGGIGDMGSTSGSASMGE